MLVRWSDSGASRGALSAGMRERVASGVEWKEQCCVICGWGCEVDGGIRKVRSVGMNKNRGK